MDGTPTSGLPQPFSETLTSPSPFQASFLPGEAGWVGSLTFCSDTASKLGFSPSSEAEYFTWEEGNGRCKGQRSGTGPGKVLDHQKLCRGGSR